MTADPDRLLLILDLDETLLHSSPTRLGRAEDFQLFDSFVYVRSHLERFLAECAARFRLAVWSSASDDYVAADSHYSYVKRLHKLKRQGYRLERMRIVDDTPAKCVHNHGNAVHVKEYTGAPEDPELPDLASYLATLANTPNVRRLEKRHWCSSVRPPRISSP